MIFTLVTAVQEKLNEIVDQIKTRREEEKKQKEREAEEAEKVPLKLPFLSLFFNSAIWGVFVLRILEGPSFTWWTSHNNDQSVG